MGQAMTDLLGAVQTTVRAWKAVTGFLDVFGPANGGPLSAVSFEVIGLPLLNSPTAQGANA